MARTKKKPETQREIADEAIGTRIPSALARRIEGIRAAYQAEAPPGVTYTKSDIVRSMLTGAAQAHEREIAKKAKRTEEQARAAHRAEHGPNVAQQTAERREDVAPEVRV